jgi:zinc/manganese transport system substrate-binding protein
MHRRTLLALPAVLAAAGARAQAAAPVVASFSILADMVRNIGGPAVSVTDLVGPDRDSHGFAPRPGDQRAVAAARAAFANGLGFDPWMDRLVRAANFRGPFVKAADGVPARTMVDAHGHGHGAGGGGRTRTVTDPHGWQDLSTAPVYARNIVAGLSRVLPQEVAAIETRAAALVAAAAETDAWVRREIATVPAERRRVLTSHDAFGHFGAAYGVTFVSPQGLSTAAEPSAADVSRLIRQVREQNIRAVFVESMTSARLVEQIAREAGVRVLGRLYADALSGPDGPAPTWLAMFRHNVPLMVSAMAQ